MLLGQTWLFTSLIDHRHLKGFSTSDGRFSWSVNDHHMAEESLGSQRQKSDTCSVPAVSTITQICPDDEAVLILFDFDFDVLADKRSHNALEPLPSPVSSFSQMSFDRFSLANVISECS